jgi:hypothetical protein
MALLITTVIVFAVLALISIVSLLIDRAAARHEVRDR